MSDRINWGILGTGNIARQFSAGVKASRRGALTAVGSRSIESAQGFAAQFGISAAYPSYDAMLADRSVDAVYVSLPNSMHHEWTIKSLRSGKHVLCEKPFAVNAGQAEEMFDVAQKQGRLLVEAFMYRSHPLTHAYAKALTSGAIGELRMIRTSFCYRTTKIDGNVRFNRELAGGVLMDVGCYCINFARYFAQAEPNTIQVSAHLHERGVDDLVVGTMQFPGGLLASFTAGMGVQADNTAFLCGTEGYIEIPVPWKPPVTNAIYTIARSTPPRMDNPGGKPTVPPRQTFSVDAGGELYGLEADDFAASVLDAVPPTISPADTLGNMRVLDACRGQIGLSF